MAKLLLTALLVAATASIFSALSRSPAFNLALREETVFGDTRVFPPEAMYDPGSYAFQRGYGFLMADGAFSADTEGRGEIAAPETARARARAAAAALSDAVRADPGNAHAWGALAWARARDLDETGALDALRASWRAAPRNDVLSETRLALVGLLTEPEIGVLALEDGDAAAVRRDAAVLARHGARRLSDLVDEAPHLKGWAAPPDAAS